FQFRKKLNAVLGSNTTDAFLAMKGVQQNFVGGRGTMPLAGGRTSPIAGWTSFLVAANAVASDTPFRVEGMYGVPTPALPPGTWEFANTYRISRPNGSDFTFTNPVYFQVKYDPYALTYGTDESTLQLYHFDGTAWTALPGSRLDADKMTLSAPITETG